MIHIIAQVTPDQMDFTQPDLLFFLFLREPHLCSIGVLECEKT